MAFATSSVLGVDLNNSSTTALFTLNQRVLGDNNSEWVYVIATGTITTGKFVSIQAAGTAIAPSTGQLMAPTGVAGGGEIGCIQCQALQGEYAWVATRGHNMIIACTGTIAPGVVVYLGGDVAGVIGGATSCTMAGIFVTTSASTLQATPTTTARGTLVYPRLFSAAATPLG